MFVGRVVPPNLGPSLMTVDALKNIRTMKEGDRSEMREPRECAVSVRELHAFSNDARTGDVMNVPFSKEVEATRKLATHTL